MDNEIKKVIRSEIEALQHITKNLIEVTNHLNEITSATLEYSKKLYEVIDDDE